MSLTFRSTLLTILLTVCGLAVGLVGCGGGTRGTETGEPVVRISGVVHDQQNNPISGADVRLGDVSIATTESDGSFHADIASDPGSQPALSIALPTGVASAPAEISEYPVGTTEVTLDVTINIDNQGVTIVGVVVNLKVEPTATPTHTPVPGSGASPTPTATANPTSTSAAPTPTPDVGVTSTPAATPPIGEETATPTPPGFGGGGAPTETPTPTATSAGTSNVT